MANPADPGTFEYWITDRITFAIMPPKADDTGDFEKWLWDRQAIDGYVKATSVIRLYGMMLRGTGVL